MTGAELRRARLAMGMTQRQLALVLGVHVNTVACWERGDKTMGHSDLIQHAIMSIAGEQIQPNRAAME